jgi:hypothetical protein
MSPIIRMGKAFINTLLLLISTITPPLIILIPDLRFRIISLSFNKPLKNPVGKDNKRIVSGRIVSKSKYKGNIRQDGIGLI